MTQEDLLKELDEGKKDCICGTIILIYSANGFKLDKGSAVAITKGTPMNYVLTYEVDNNFSISIPIEKEKLSKHVKIADYAIEGTLYGAPMRIECSSQHQRDMILSFLNLTDYSNRTDFRKGLKL